MTKIEAARAEALDQHLSFWQNDDGEIVDVVRHIRPALGINR
jgi:hypothetical protein